jgi:hypothetical protein
MSRNILIAVAALAVIALIAAFGFKAFHGAGDLFASKDDTPAIMIVTGDMVQETVTGQITEAAVNAALHPDPAAASATAAPAATSDKAATKTAAAGAAPKSTPVATGPNMSLLVQSLQDPFLGALGDEFQQSGRFNVIATPAIKEELAKYGHGEAPSQKSKGSVTFSGVKALANKGKKDEPAEATAAATQETAEMPARGLKEAAQKLNAKYVLLVSMTLPDSDFRYIRTGDTVSMTAQPIVNYEIYDARTGERSYRKSEQLPKAITEVVSVGDSVPRSSLETYYKFRTRLNHAAALFVLNNVLQEIAPPRITRTGSQIVINRGANDGVRVGAVYDVERETGATEREGVDDKGKGGRDLEKVRTPVGQIRIDRVQGKISVASSVSGGPFQKDDVVMFSGGVPGSAAGGASGGGDAVALGSRALSQADMKGGPPLRQASISIDHVTIGGADSLPLSRALASALQQDRRITVLSRADLVQVLQERSLNQGATGESGSLQEGMRTAGYLIVGEFHTATARHDKTLSVGGESTVLSSSTSSSVTGTLRALSVDGTLVESADVKVSSGNIEEVANAAARALLLKLFPMKVVQVDAASGVIRLNRGDDAGLKAGQHVKIFSLGEKIVDPQTGTLLSEGARTLVGEIVLTQVDPSVSTGRFAAAPFPVAVGYDALAGSGGAGPGPAAPAKGAKPRKAEKPEADVRF